MEYKLNGKLISYLESTQNILDYARFNSEISLYLHNPSNHEVIRLIENNSFLVYARTACQRITIIEIYKIISNSHHDLHSFNNLLKNISTACKEDQIKKWKNNIQEHENSISTIKLLRNKIYGHNDTNYLHEITYNFLEINTFIVVLQSIFDEIISKLELQIHSRFNNENLEDLNGQNFLNKFLNRF